MKKIFIFVILIGALFFPINTFAKKYNTLNLDEVLTEEGITHDFSSYKETDEQVIIYLFRGKGCDYCKKFLKFLNSIIDEYGQYFKVVSYETWNDVSNKALMNKVANKLDTKATGVPFIVIGNTYYPGYDEEYNDHIKETIMNEYEANSRYDIMKEIEKDSENKTGNKTFILIILVAIIVFAVGFYMYYDIKKTKKA